MQPQPSTRKKKSLRRRLVFSLIPLAVLFILGELLARGWLYYLAPPSAYLAYAVPSEFPACAKYRPHHYFAYQLQPKFVKGMTHHNSLGFRGRELSVEKPTGQLRIALLGGSTSYGEFIDNDNDTIACQLEDQINQQMQQQAASFAVPKPDGVAVINAGVPGYNSWESLADFQFRVLDLKPDIVLIAFGVNDIHCRLVEPNQYLGDNSGRRQRWHEPLGVQLASASVLARIVGYHAGLWRLPGVDTFVKAPSAKFGSHADREELGADPLARLKANPPTFFARNVRSTIGTARANGVMPILISAAYSDECGDWAARPHYQQGYAELNQVIRELARELNVPLIDLAEVTPKDRKYWRDGRHVNELGARLQATKLAADLLPTIRGPQQVRHAD